MLFGEGINISLNFAYDQQLIQNFRSSYFNHPSDKFLEASLLNWLENSCDVIIDRTADNHKEQFQSRSDA